MPLSWLRSLRRKGVLEVIPGVYQITVRGANIIVIVEAEITLVDVGFRGSSEHLLSFLRTIGRSIDEVSLIIVTHNHYDHTGGLADLRAITRARVAAHRADTVDGAGQLPYPDRVRWLLRLRPFSGLRSVLSISSRDIDITLSGGDVLKPLGGLHIVHTPGHTPGSISLFSPQKRLLIVGDALDKAGRGILPPHRSTNTDNEQAIESVKKLASLSFDTLCFGHGRPFKQDAGDKMRRLLARVT